MTRGINEEVARAMRWTRESQGMSPDQWARELNHLVSGYELTAQDVIDMEDGTSPVLGPHLVAAARIAEQPVSVCLGELDAYEVAIPLLEARIAVIEDRLERASSRDGSPGIR